MGDSPAGADDPAGCGSLPWDESEARNVYADAARVTANPDEVCLIFGTSRIRRRDEEFRTVALTNRFAMTPGTAKLLSLQLSNIVRQYEAEYGPLASNASSATSIPVNAHHRAGDQPALLFRLIESLHVEVGYEQSFKVVREGLLDNRFLLGVSKKEVGEQAEERLTEICSLLGMPKPLSAVFSRHLSMANYVHFGFERENATSIYKVYLEFWDRIENGIKKTNQSPGPALLHLGLKWDASSPMNHVVTRYTWFPWLSGREIMQRVSGRWAAEELVSLALARVPQRDLLYLDVTEEGNPRRSFDINVYKANLLVEQIYPLLSVLCRRYSIPFAAFHSLYERIGKKRLGHLAAGLDRKGNDFCTIYYGVEELLGGRPSELSQVGRTTPEVKRRPIFKIEETDEKAGRLFRLVKGLAIRGVVERSFKLLERTLLTDRFLIGIERESTEQDDILVDACRQLNMPKDCIRTFRAELHEAKIVVFGFERNEKRRLYKVYLEFTERLAGLAEGDHGPEGVAIYTGFKWDAVESSRGVLARYCAYPFFRASDIAARVRSAFYSGQKRDGFPIVDDILDLVGSRTRPGELLYLEVSEEGSSRSSFDLNAYKAGLRMAETYPLLVRMARQFSIDLRRFDELYECVKEHKFGHLSGGMDREGRDFLTVYFRQKR